MKKLLYALICLALALNSCGPVYVVHQDPPPQAEPTSAPPQEVSYQSFYDQLAPYGEWIDDPGYGYVWMPNVGPEFKPYATNGHWVYTDEGWTWASEYPWGWAAFHYGRWFYQDGYGWMWIPGHEWAPAWVSWRNSPDYYGWAPLGPNISISVSIGGGYNPPSHYWCFVPHQYVASPQVNNYYVNESRNTTIINNTTVINNTTIINNNTRNTNITNNNTVINNNTRINNRSYAGGPNPDEVGRFTGSQLRPVALRESNTPGERMNGGQLAIYRPHVNPATAPDNNRGGGGTGNVYGGNEGRPTVAPARAQPLNNVRPVNTMRYNNGFNNGYNNPNNNNGNPPHNSFNERLQQNMQSERNGQPAGNVQPPVNGQANPNGQSPDFRQRTVQPVQPQVQNGRPGQSMPAPQDNAPAQQQGMFRRGNPPNGSPANTAPVNTNPVNTAPPHSNPSTGTPPMSAQQPRGFARPIPNAQPLKPVAKPSPVPHSDTARAKDNFKFKGQKEQ